MQEAHGLTPGCSSVCARKLAPRLVSFRLKVQPYTPPPCLYRVPVTISQFVCNHESQQTSTAAPGKLGAANWLAGKTLFDLSNSKQPATLITLLPQPLVPVINSMLQAPTACLLLLLNHRRYVFRVVAEVSVHEDNKVACHKL